MPAPADDRLDSWKEIAAYLGRGPRTVQRWEKTEALPVHRHMHERQGTVYAFRSELDHWWAGRRARLEAEHPPSALPEPRQPVHRRWAAAAAVTFAATLAVGTLAWRDASAAYGPSLRISALRPLTSSIGFEFGPAFSPDGDSVAYSWEHSRNGGSDIYIQRVGQGAPARLTDDPASDVNPCWSADGRLIAFLRAANGGRDAMIVVKPAFGGEERTVATVPWRKVLMPALAWTASNEWLLVALADIEDKPSRLYRVSVSTGELRPITTACTAGCSGDAAIALTPDRRGVAFLRVMSSGVRDIYTMELDAEGQPVGPERQVTRQRSVLTAPVWLPGARALAYSVIADIETRWYQVPRRGGLPRPLETLENFRPGILFSPDGRRMLSPSSEIDYDLRMVRLTDPGEHDAVVSTRIDANPHIAPDGKQVVFASDRLGPMAIWKSATDGSNAVPLVSFPRQSCGTPRWSPDGREIAFDVTSDTGADIYVMASDGARVRRITDHPGRDFVPSWSRDGKWIYFGSDRTGAHQIWKASAAGGEAGQVTRSGGYGAVESFDGTELYVTKYTGKGENGRGIWRVSKETGEEQLISDMRIDWSRLNAGRAGLWYIEYDPTASASFLRLLPRRDKTPRTIRKLDVDALFGFSMAPDESWMIYGAVRNNGLDVMISDVH